MQKLIWLVPLAPLAGSLANALFGRVTRERAHWVALPAVGLSFIFASFVFNRVWQGETLHAPLYQWIVAGNFKAQVTAHVDQLTALMLLIVTGVGLLIHLYSVGYMHGDPGYARYFTYLNLFVFSMVMLVVAGD